MKGLASRAARPFLFIPRCRTSGRDWTLVRKPLKRKQFSGGGRLDVQACELWSSRKNCIASAAEILGGGNENFVGGNPHVLQAFPVLHDEIGFGNGKSVKNLRVHSLRSAIVSRLHHGSHRSEEHTSELQSRFY